MRGGTSRHRGRGLHGAGRRDPRARARKGARTIVNRADHRRDGLADERRRGGTKHRRARLKARPGRRARHVSARHHEREDMLDPAVRRGGAHAGRIGTGRVIDRREMRFGRRQDTESDRRRRPGRGRSRRARARRRSRAVLPAGRQRRATHRHVRRRRARAARRGRHRRRRGRGPRLPRVVVRGGSEGKRPVGDERRGWWVGPRGDARDAQDGEGEGRGAQRGGRYVPPHREER